MMSGDHELSCVGGGRVAVYSHSAPRRRWPAELKAQIVAESYASTVAEVAARYMVSPTQLFGWRRDARRAEGLGFAEVKVEGAAETAPTGAIELAIGSAQMRIEAGADLKMATALVMALKAAR